MKEGRGVGEKKERKEGSQGRKGGRKAGSEGREDN